MANKVDPQRLRQMESLLRWEGQVGNARLRELFGLSTIRASQWLKELRDAHPDWTRWNSVPRCFEATGTFQHAKAPKYGWDLNYYLALVGLPNAVGKDDKQVVVAAFPDINMPNSMVFAVLSGATRMNHLVKITYISLNEPTPHELVIAPHSLARAAAQAWHVRAYCETSAQFEDFALGRITRSTSLKVKSVMSMSDDLEWMTEVPVRLSAHPDLSQEQEAVVRYEYFANTASRVTTCRGPLVKYFVRHCRAATDVKTQLPPEYVVVVENIKEVAPWLKEKHAVTR